MKSYRNFVLASTLLTLLFTARSQENSAAACSNGVDDDGDTLVDCFDPECAQLATCDEFFFGNSVVCFDEVDVTTFAIRQQWGSADQTATSHASPAIGDLDQNGIPEVIAVNNYGNTVTVLNGATGATMFQASVGFNPENTPAIANVDLNETSEILVTQNEGRRLVLFSHDLSSELWRVEASRDDMGMAGFADFNEDGVPEVYYKNEIRNAQTGALIIEGDGDWERDYVHGPIAVDILPDAACDDCAGLELVTGSQIWSVDIAGAEMNVERDMNDITLLDSDDDPQTYRPLYWGEWLDGTRSTVSVADYNLDGTMDVILTGALGTTGTSSTDEVSIFMWDVENANVLIYHDSDNNFRRGPGRVNLADVDGDGLMNANFVMDQFLYSLDENFEIHWKRGIKEGSSGFTGCSLFDFDGDGVVEVVYRSEESIQIREGVAGNIRNEIACVSRTQEEYPVVADVDGDGASEICVACYTNNGTSFSPYSNTQFSQIRVYESDGEAWMPARSVWNQHGYFTVNINDDLTVPIELQDHTLIFSDGLCEYSDGTTIPFPARPLNTFLNQAPILDENGCVEFVSPDMVILGNDISATDASCPDAEITVTFTLTNEGDTDISGGLPVSYYAGDPTEDGSIYLDTEVEALLAFDVGESRVIEQTINGIGGEYDLYVVVNDLGGTPGITSAPGAYDELPSATIPECETGNNYNFVRIGFEPFELTVEKLEDDRRCDLDLTPNGSATAYYFGPSPGQLENIYLENFDDRTAGDQTDSDETAWTSDPGTNNPTFYGVISYNGSLMFGATLTGTSNGIGNVTWTSEAIDISKHEQITLSVDLFENGDAEGSNSEWQDFIEMTYQTFDSDNNPVSSGTFSTNGFVDDDFTYRAAVESSLRPTGTEADSSVIITATIHNTSDAETHYIDNILVNGKQEDVIKIHDESDGFEFNWYNAGDYNTILHTGSTYAQMAPGTYEVISSFASTSCGSDTVEVTIENLNEFSTPQYLVYAWAYEAEPITDCEDPNGTISGFVYTTTEDGSPPPATESNPPADTLRSADGYTFTWFITSEGVTPIGTGDEISGLIERRYTVRAVEDFSGCEGSADADITSDLSFPPSPDVVVTNINTCGGTGTLSASIAGNTVDYVFEWFDGPGEKPTPDFTGAVYEVSEIGEYTVRATEIASSCPSNTTTETMGDDANAPVLTAEEVDPNTTCGLTGNGSAQAIVNGAVGTPGFTYQWFIGNNTLAQYQIPNATDGGVFGAGEWEMTEIKSGIYTIVVQEDATLCTDTTTVEVTDNFVEPEFVLNNEINTGDAITLTGLGYVELPQLFGAGNPVTDALTISYWADFSPTNYADDERVFSSGATGENQVLLWSDNHNGLAFVVETQGDAADRGRINSAYSATGWAHVTGTWDASTGEMKLYANGVLIGEDTYTGTGIVVDTGNPMYLGRDGNSSDKKFEGTVDELRIYNKALTSTEINEQMCRELTGTEDGLVAYWNFNNVAGPSVADGATVPDESGNGHDGTARTSTGSVDTELADIECPIAEAVANSSCDPANPNGSIDISSFVTPVSAYTFTLYEGFSTTTQLDQNTSGLFEGLAGGFYTLTAEDQVSECITGPVTVSLADIPDIPNINSTVLGDGSCSIGSGEIQITSSSNGEEPGTYTYELFQGSTFTTLLTSVSVTNGTTGHTFSNLEAGGYLVRVTNDDLLCFDVLNNIVVGDATVDPVFLTNAEGVNTSCSDPNGFVTVTVDADLDGLQEDADDFDFFWYDGENTSAPVLVNGVQGRDILSLATGFNVDAGFYTVVAQSRSTGCPTVPLTLEVFDDAYIPNIVITEVDPQTDCGTGNGSLAAHVTNDPDGLCTVCTEANGFSFQWQLDGVDLQNGVAAANGSVPSGVTTSTVSGLISDEYTVVVTYDDLGCDESANFALTEEQVFPTVSLNTKQNNEFCDPASYNGFITVQVAFDGEDPVADLSGYNFTWYNGAGASRTLNTSSTSETLSAIMEGTYSVEVQAPNSCPSLEFTETIIDVLPAIGAGESAQANNTVCSPADNDIAERDFNGTITFTPTGGANTDGNYSFALVETTGPTTLDPILANNAGLAVEFQDVEYTASGSSSVVLGLPEGDYEMTITDDGADGSNCTVTHAFSITDDFTNLPTIAINTGDITANTACAGGTFNGGADASAWVSPAGTYAYEWTGPATASTAVISGVQDGAYTLTVTDLVTGCSASTPVTIPESTPDITPGESAQANNTVCSPADNDIAERDFNGTITFTPTGGANTDGNYSFALVETTGPTTLDPVLANNAGLAVEFQDVEYTASGSSSVVLGLPEGDYEMTITDDGADGSNCTVTHAFSITDDFTNLPTIAINTGDITANTACAGGTFNGGADASAWVSPAGTYAYEWTGPATASTAVISGVQDGAYTLTVTDLVTGCSASTPVTIPESTPDITPGESAQANNTVCSPADNDIAERDFNGTITFTPTGGANTDGNYSFALVETTGPTTLDPVLANNAGLAVEFQDVEYTASGSSSVVLGLPEGDYEMTITDDGADGSNCTVTHAFSITDDFTNLPTIAINTGDITANTACAGGTFNGGADASAWVSPAGTYAYEWTGPATASTAVISGVQDGAYTLTVTDLVTGCSASTPVTIPESTPDITPGESAQANNTVCSPADNDIAERDFNGTITFTPTGGANTDGNYSFALVETTGPTTLDPVLANNAGLAVEFQDVEYTASGSSSVVLGLPEGDYEMTITDDGADGSNCTVTHAFSITDDFTNLPTIAINTGDITANTACAGGTFNGGADASAWVSPAGTYAYEWTGPATASTAVISGVQDGAYTLTVTDLVTGCSASTPVTIPESTPDITPGESAQANNTVCSPTDNDIAERDFNGTITFTPTGGANTDGNYSFALVETTGPTTLDPILANNAGLAVEFQDVEYTASGSSSVVLGLPEGDYEMTITDDGADGSNCTVTHAFSITDDFTNLPTIAINTGDITANTACAGGTFNGGADASAWVSPAGTYAYEWTGPATASTAVISGVQDGAYTLTVTDLVTGCSASTPVTIPESTPDITPGESAQANNTVCSPADNDIAERDFNGTITFTPTGGANTDGNYSFALVETTGPTTLDPVLANNAGLAVEFQDVEYTATGSSSVVLGLPEGDYEMTITDDGADGSNCTVTHAFSITDDFTNLPTIAINTGDITANTACAGGTFNGGADASAWVSPAGTYAYEWTGPATASTAVISGVQDGAYTLTVTDLVTGCSASTPVTIPESTPDITPGESAQANNTVCSPADNDIAERDFNGTITFTPTGGANTDGNYSFALVETTGPTTLDPVLANNAGLAVEFQDVEYTASGSSSVVLGLPEGDYEMTITDDGADGSNCTVTHAFSITDDFTNLPTIAINTGDITANTACAGGTFNGGADASAWVSPAGTYAYEWTGPATASTAVISGVQDGAYTLTVTDLVTGCSASTPVTIPESTPDITPGESAQANNTVCSPTDNDIAERDFNGTITFTPTGGANTDGNYSFALVETTGPTTLDPILANNAGLAVEFQDVEYTASGSSSVVLGLPEGDYEMTITDDGADGSNCTVTHAFSITDDFTNLPTIAINTGDITANTACAGGTFNGGADASAWVSPAGTYAYEWTGPATASTAVISGVQDGAYTLTVTDLVTGCSASTPVTIPESTPDITPGESAQANNTVCSPADNDIAERDFNGTITFTPTGGANTDGNYSFALVETTGPTTLDPVLANNAGLAVEFQDVEYTATGSSSVVLGLPEGDYEMTITDDGADGSNCTVTHAFSITDDFTNLPTITIVSGDITANTVCVANPPTVLYDGSADATNWVSPVGSYAYEWTLSGTPAFADDDAILDDDDGTNDGVINGLYTLTVTDNETGCSASIDVTVPKTDPVIALDATVFVDNYSCDNSSPTGGATVTVSGTGGTNAGYTFSWHNGPSGAGVSIDGDNILANVVDATYSVVVTETASGCSEVFPITIEPVEAIIGLTPTPGSQTTCSPDGVVSVDANITNAASIDGFTNDVGTNYTFEWYEGTDASGATLLGDGSETLDNGSVPVITSNATTGVSSMSGLYFGDYTVVVTETNTGCVTAKETINVADNISVNIPTITFHDDGTFGSNLPNACDNDGGILVAEITASALAASSYSFEWYEGSGDFVFAPGTPIANGVALNNGTTNPLIDNSVSGRSTLSQVRSGLYTLVTTDANGCRSQHVYNLGFVDQQTTTTLAIRHVEECPDDGEASVGLANSFQNDHIELASSAGFGIGETIEGSAATFTATIDNISGNTLELSNASGTFIVGETITQPSSPGPTSTVTSVIEVFEDFDDITTYDIFLFSGNGIPAAFYADPDTYTDPDLTTIDGATSTAGGTVSFTTLASGTYTAVALEKTGSRCFTDIAIDEIEDRAYEPVITSIVETDNTLCVTGPGNGEITINVEKNPDDTFQPGEFQVRWFESGDDPLVDTPLNDPAPDLVTTSTISNLDPGDYFAVISRQYETYQFNYTPGAGSFVDGETVTIDGGNVVTGVILTDNAGTDMTIYITASSVGDDTDIMLTDNVTGSSSGATATVNGAVVTTTSLNGCETTTSSITIQDTPEQHEVTGITITDNENCNVVDGSAEITAILDALTDYRYQWLASDLTTQLVQIPYDNLSGGPFVDGSAITIGAETGTILADNGVDAMVVSGLSGAVNDDDAIDFGTGTTTAQVNSPTVTTIDPAGTQSMNELNPLPGETYYVQATHITKGCVTTQLQVDVPDLRLDPTLDVVITSQDTSCDDVTPTGQATVSITNGSFDVDDYIFTWYVDAGGTDAIDGVDVPTATFDGTGGSGLTANGQAGVNRVSGLIGGVTYYVQVEKINPSTGLGDGCSSIVEAAAIEQFNTVISVGGENGVDFNLADQENCEPDDGSFSILDITETRPGGTTLSVTGGDFNLSDYSFRWADDAANDLVVIPYDNLSGGPFVDGSAVTIGAETGTILSDNGTDAMVVSGLSGAVNDDDAIDFGTGTTTAQVNSPTVTTIDPTGTVAASAIAPLPAGDYSVLITNTTTGCFQSADQAVDFTIEDLTETPTLDVVITSQDTSCDDVTPTGQATVSITNGSFDVDDYIFTWYVDAGGTDAIDGVDVPTATFDGTGGSGLTANGQAGVNRVSGLIGGVTYYVQVEKINPSTGLGDGCSSVVEAAAIEQFNTVISVGGENGVDFNLADQENCEPDDGSFSILDITETRPGGTTLSVTGGDFNLSDYSFRWADDAANDLVVIPYDNLSGGPFVDGSAVTIGAETGTILSDNGTDAMVVSGLSGAVNDDDAIDFGTGTTTAQVNSPTVTTIDPTGTVAASAIAPLPAGDYSVLITNTTTGCFQSADQAVDFTIEDLTETPTLDVVITSQDTSCDDVTPTGQATVSITNGSFDVDDYIFTWYVDAGGTDAIDGVDVPTATFDGTGGSGLTANGQAGVNRVSGLIGGVTYYVQVEKINPSTGLGDGCSSVVEAAAIEQFNTVISVGGENGVDFNLADQENCEPDDGSFSILDITETRPGGTTLSVTGGDFNLSDYSFRWADDAANDLVVIPYDNLSGGPFVDGSAVTIGAETGTILSDNGTDAMVVSGLSGAVNDDDAIDFGTGTTTAQVNSPTVTTIDPTGTVAASAIAPLPAGDYSVLITNTTTGCFQSADQAVDFTIEDLTETPTLDVVITSQDTSCDDVTPTGQATVSITNGSFDVDDYIFTWYVDAGGTDAIDGVDVPTATFDGTGGSGLTTNGQAGVNRVSGLIGGVTYYVQVEKINPSTGLGDGCSSVVEAAAIEQFNTVISVGGENGVDFNLADQENCEPDDGSFSILDITETRPGGTTLSVTGGDFNLSDYSFRWADDAANDLVVIPYDNLSGGPFVDGSAVTIGAETGTILSDNGTDAMVVSGLSGAVNDDDAIDFGTGTTTAQVNSPTVTTIDPTGTVAASAIAPLPAGDYSVLITNTTTGCFQSADQAVDFTIEDLTETPTLDVVITSQDTSCDDVTPTGQATVSITNGSFDVDDYIFTWYVDAGGTDAIDGVDVPTATFDGTGGSGLTANGQAGVNRVSGLIGGVTYYVQVEKINPSTGLGDGCSSVVEAAAIEQFNTVISVGGENGVDFNLADQENCEPDDGSFSILDITETRPGGTTLSVTGGDFNLSDYSFRWADDAANDLVVIPYDNLSGGPFVDGSAVTIGAETGTILSDNGTDAMVVSGLSGAVNDDDAIDFGTGTTTAQVNSPTVTTIDPTGTVAASAIAPLPAGDYSVLITNTTTGCFQSADQAVDFTIEDLTETPTLDVVITSQDTSCDDVTPTGQATVSITNGSFDVDDYIFTWYVDAGGTDAIDGVDVPTATFDGTGGSGLTANGQAGVNRVSGLIGGVTYYVQVEKINPSTGLGDGCSSVVEAAAIEQFNTVISVGGENGVDFNLADQENCEPDDGSFSILDITETRPGGTTLSVTGGDFNLSDYSFRWADDAANDLVVIPYDNLSGGPFVDGSAVTIGARNWHYPIR